MLRLERGSLNTNSRITCLFECPMRLSSLLIFRAHIWFVKSCLTTTRSNDLRFLDDVSGFSIHSASTLFLSSELLRRLCKAFLNHLVVCEWLVMCTWIRELADFCFISCYRWCPYRSWSWFRARVILFKRRIVPIIYLVADLSLGNWRERPVPLLFWRHELRLFAWNTDWHGWRMRAFYESDYEWLPQRIQTGGRGFCLWSSSLRRRRLTIH